MRSKICLDLEDLHERERLLIDSTIFKIADL
jgi:hypothetical protein